MLRFLVVGSSGLLLGVVAATGSLADEVGGCRPRGGRWVPDTARAKTADGGIEVTEFVVDVGHNSTTDLAMAYSHNAWDITFTDCPGLADENYSNPPYFAGDTSTGAHTYQDNVAVGHVALVHDFNTGVHEVGHELGFNHFGASADADLTMYNGEFLDETKKETLGYGDILGMRHSYGH